jgi:hypothetical protein
LATAAPPQRRSRLARVSDSSPLAELDIDKTSLGRSKRPAIWSRRLPWWVEALIAVCTYELYDAVQALTAGDAAEARFHGLTLVHGEQRLHVWIEPAVNRFASAHNSIGLSAGYIYALAHVTVTLVVLAVLWRRHPDAYPILRNVLLMMSLLALVAFWLWPVSPPRLTVDGFTDIVVRHDILGAAHVRKGLVNYYAAMPSLHVAWACWCAGSLALTSRTTWRHVVWLYPVLMTFVVVATANHYLVDAAAGAALAAASLTVVKPRLRRATAF